MVKKAKKRGVKSGTKRGKYKILKVTAISNSLKVGDKVSVEFPFNKTYTPSPVLTLCGHLEDAILLLENRISNSIAKINSLM